MSIFQDKVAIVTGGASGIGQAVTQELLKRGAKVVVADINIENVLPVTGKLHVRRVDVTQADQVQDLVNQTVEEFGRLDYIFNNAGFAIAGELRDMTSELWDKILAVNLKGVINGVLAAYPVMIKQGSGHIVNTASLAGLVSSPVLGAYTTTKFAVVGFSQSLRAEAALYGVKVSVLCPGFIKTNIYSNSIYVGTNEGANDNFTNLLPVKLMEVERAAELILEGVEKNRAIITMPAYSKVLWGLQRLSPSLGIMLSSLTLKRYRKALQQNK
ncbi:MAG TPA: SDR family NAD(P)-dependent oxidoreductase [Chloroflexia bacterium]|nr:SDR family NAD(P)-dependent oxidoreductase [Chloroflexia bacterium]